MQHQDVCTSRTSWLSELIQGIKNKSSKYPPAPLIIPLKEFS
nr:unnamed protein product [Moritella viscosa]